MATVRRPSSLAARKMRIAISLRLAASSLWIGLVFFISGAINASREILHCFMEAARPSCSLFDLKNRLFLCAEGGQVRGSVYAGPTDWLVARAWAFAQNLQDQK